MSAFGKKRLADFYLDPTYININHGSYGSCPKVVMEVKRKYEQQCDFNTEKWFRYDAEKQINQTRKFVAQKIHCNVQNVYLVQNATDAFNCLVKSMKWAAGDIILIPNTAYASIRKTCIVLRDRYGVELLDINFTHADFQSHEKIQIKIQDFVNSYPKKIKLAVFDHIVSVPAIVFPVKTMQIFFEQKKIPLFIDGAHAICHVDVSMKDLNPQAYFSNFHKWAFAPKNAAFLYISDEFLEIVKPVITGNFHGQGPEREFFWTGTRDFTSYLCIKKGFQYIESFGANAVVNYNHDLVMKASKRMAQIWKTQPFTSDQRCIGNLCNVIVPSKDINLCVNIANKMMYEVNCYPIFAEFDGKVICRISAQLFNEISDYEFAATTFLQYLTKNEKKQIK